MFQIFYGHREASRDYNARLTRRYTVITKTITGGYNSNRGFTLQWLFLSKLATITSMLMVMFTLKTPFLVDIEKVKD